MPVIALLFWLALSAPLLSHAATPAAEPLAGCEREGVIVYSRECLQAPPAAPSPVDTAPTAPAAVPGDARGPAEATRAETGASRPLVATSPWAARNSSACADRALVEWVQQGEADRLSRCALTPERLAQATPGGRTLMHWAVAAGQVETATALIEAGAPLGTPSRRDRGGHPLHLAAKNGDPILVKRLLEAGAPIEGRDLFGYTPLHQAVTGGRIAVVEVLLNAGAPLEAQDRTGKTPLLAAALYRRPAMVATLLKAGANATARDRRGQTALDYAAGQPALIKPLLAAGMGSDTPTLLKQLAQEGIAANWPSIQLLLAQEPRFSAPQGGELLRLSLQQEHLPFFRRLLTLGVDPGPLSLASFQGRPAFMQTILEFGLLQPRETEAAQNTRKIRDGRG